MDGFVIPLHRSLTEPIMMAGVPRNIAIINGTLAAALGLGLQLWMLGLFVWVAGHGVALFVTAKDPAFMDVLMRHMRYPNNLEA